MHPLAFENNKSSACGINAGDRVVYAITMQRGVADEFLHDGDAFVTWDDGSHGTVKWNYLYPDTDEGIKHARLDRLNRGIDHVE